ncbi:cellulase family glycosylhydrolase [Streptomyces sp. KL118A]|uniref:cellulase family glycosylhydrolase n=1 Tax=Streptomyces sp. KL118A TaxID=3045153 RepID=UPI00278BBB29|nr:cellulase family glycosylhydrolase [Streptomyces sp. KL118A]
MKSLAAWRTWAVGAVVLAVAAALLVAVGPQGAGAGRADTASGHRWITDRQGRALVLRGLSTASSAKQAADGMPWIEEKDVARERRSLGTNFVRFLLQWRKVEPSPGTYDRTYLRQVAERVRWYGKRGYHVLLDMHQDLYGPRVGGNGAPAWATGTDGLTSAPTDPWELGYVEPGTVRAFDRFWGTVEGDGRDLREHYVGAVREVARHFAADDTVIGYDLMNEPWGGSVQGPAFEAGPLARLYQDAIDAVRTVDRDHWLFVEPSAIGSNWGFATGLPRLDDPRGDGDAARIAYAPHLYPLPMDLGGGYTGSTKGQVDRSLRAWREQTEKTARRLGAPVVIGEFGLDTGLPGAMEYVEKVQRMADDMGAGFAYWSNDPGPWAPWDAKLRPTKLLPVLDRPAPLAVAGDPVAYGWDEAGKTLTVSWRGTADARGGTEVRLPARHFPKGGRVAGGTQRAWHPESRVLTLDSGPGKHSVRITPRR